MNVKQFELWTLNLNPTKGSEQSGVRPCLIVETNATMNQGKTTIVIPVTTNIQKIFSFDIFLFPNKETGLQKKSKLKLRQIRVIDKTRLIQRIGKVTDLQKQKKILESLKLLFDCSKMFS